MTGERQPPEAGDRTALAAHHRDLERRFAALMVSADSGDAHQLREEWSRCEQELLQHLDVEERDVLPAFAREHPEEAREIREEHEQIRKALLELGIGADLHRLGSEVVRAFVVRLRVHASREESLLYGWAAQHVEPGVWREIGAAITRPRSVSAQNSTTRTP